MSDDTAGQTYNPRQSNSIQYRKQPVKVDTGHSYVDVKQIKKILDFNKTADPIEVQDEESYVYLSEFGSVFIALVFKEIQIMQADNVQLSDKDMLEIAVYRIQHNYKEFSKADQ
eukprot:EST44955.1 Hypothetical protein SS50377_14973 [Spironucleus salmonicida]